jgi:hypothetical protein
LLGNNNNNGFCLDKLMALGENNEQKWGIKFFKWKIYFILKEKSKVKLNWI